jgi:hypothetical protein
MTSDEALAASAREATKRQADDFDRRLASEIVEMIRNAGVDANLVLELVDAMMNVTLPDLRPAEPQPGALGGLPGQGSP